MEFQAGQQLFSVTFSAGISLYPANQSVKGLSDAVDRAHDLCASMMVSFLGDDTR